MGEHGKPDFKQRLIDLVQQNPALYDTDDCHYKDPAYKMALWDSFCEILAFKDGGGRLMAKWNNLRDMYRREKKKHRTSSGVRWAHFGQLRWLDAHMDDRIGQPPNPDQSIAVTADSFFNDANSLLLQDEEYEMKHENAEENEVTGLAAPSPVQFVYSQPSPAQSSTYSVASPGQTARATTRKRHAVNQPDTQLTYAVEKRSETTTEPETMNVFFGRYLASELDSMTADRQMYARHYIQNFLYQFQTGLHVPPTGVAPPAKIQR